MAANTSKPSGRKIAFLVAELLLFLVFVREVYPFFFTLLLDFGSGANGTSFALFSSEAPLYLEFLTLFYALILVRYFSYSRNPGKKTLARVHGAVLLALSLLLFVLALLGLVRKTAHNAFFSFYPGFLLFTSLLKAAFGFLLLFFPRFFVVSEGLPSPMERPKVQTIQESCFDPVIFLFLSYYVSVFSKASFYSGWTSNGNHALGLTGFFLWILLALFFLLSRFVGEYLFFEQRVPRGFRLAVSGAVLGLDFVFLLWMFLAEKADPNFLTESLTALFPADHMMIDAPAFSVLILFFTLLVSSLYFLLVSLFGQTRRRKEEERTKEKTEAR